LVRLWTPDRGALPEKALRATFQVFIRKEESGIMQLRAAGAADIDLYYVEGLIVGAESAADDELLARRLTASGTLPAETLDRAAEAGIPLHEFLGTLDEVTEEAKSKFLVERFRDNLFRAHVQPWTSVVFDRGEVALPGNVQFGHDPFELLAEAERWCVSIRPMLQFLAPGSLLDVDPRNDLADGDAATLVALFDRPMTRDEVLERSPLEGYSTLWWLAWLLNRGVIRPASWHTSADDSAGSSSP